MDTTQFESLHPDHSALRPTWDHALDAYDGVGGYLPWPDAYGNGYFGQIGSDTNRPAKSYLDQHPRESNTKFGRRCRGAVYTNIARAIGETILGFLLRRDPTRSGGSDAVNRFLEDSDGKGTPWQEVLRRQVAPRTMLFGTCPILVDRPQVSGRSRADIDAVGATTYAVPYYPQTLFDWEVDDAGVFEWAKLVDERAVKAAPDKDRETEKQARIWHQDRWELWRLSTADQNLPKQIGEGDNPTGEVPIVMASFADAMRSSVLGTTFMQTVCNVGRRIYNIQSELDDHLRNQVFAVLCIPTEGDPTGVTLGTDNAMKCAVQGNMPTILAPPSSVSETLFAAMDRLRDEAYAAAKLGFTLATKQQPESGIARAYEFQATNRQISAFAASMVRTEMDVLRLVCRWEGEDPDAALADYQVQWPDDYDIRDIDTAVRRALDVVTLPIQRTAMAAYVKTLRDDLVELSEEEKAESDDEIDAALADGAVVPVAQAEPNVPPVVDEAGGEDVAPPQPPEASQDAGGGLP